MSKKIKILLIIFGILDLLMITFLVLSKTILKDKLISSFNNNYINYVLYDEDDVFVTLAKREKYNNLQIDDCEVIEVEKEEEVDSSYEDNILINNTGNKNYKYIKTSVSGYDAHLVVIYDASKVRLITSARFNTGNSQETATNMCKREGATVCINGGGFVDYGTGSDTPIGYLIKDSKIVWSDSRSNNDKGDLIGFDKNNKLTLVNASGNEALEMGIRDALQFGPFLIVNGKDIDMTNNMTGGYAGASRVAIAQRKDGIVLFLVTEGMHGRGPSLADVQKTLKLYGAYNAANLDGGASSQLVISGNLINKPINIYGEIIYGGRRIVSGFGLKE